MEGGAMRGLFSAGVIDVMMRQGLDYNALIGVSAGEAFGCNYKSKQIGRVIRYNHNLAHDWRYCSWRSFFLTGDLYGGHFCYHTLPGSFDIMDKTAYDNNPMDLIVVATDVHNGQPVYHSVPVLDYEGLEWMRASASMPAASRVVHVGGYDLLDGGVSDAIPVRYAQQQGYEKIVAVLTQPYGYVKGPQKDMKLLAGLLKNYPAIVERLADRHDRYNACLDDIRQEEQAGRIFVIRPPQGLHIPSICHDVREMERVYQTGVATARQQMPALLAYLKA